MVPFNPKNPITLQEKLQEAIFCTICGFQTSLKAKCVLVEEPTSNQQRREPYFPFLKRNNNEGSNCVQLCSFCHALLLAQWNYFEKDANYVMPSKRIYNLNIFPCGVCGTMASREDVRGVAIQEFPFLNAQRNDKALILEDEHNLGLVVCSSCHKSLVDHKFEYDQMNLRQGSLPRRFGDSIARRSRYSLEEVQSIQSQTTAKPDGNFCCRKCSFETNPIPDMTKLLLQEPSKYPWQDLTVASTTCNTNARHAALPRNRCSLPSYFQTPPQSPTLKMPPVRKRSGHRQHPFHIEPCVSPEPVYRNGYKPPQSCNSYSSHPKSPGGVPVPLPPRTRRKNSFTPQDFYTSTMQVSPVAVAVAIPPEILPGANFTPHQTTPANFTHFGIKSHEINLSFLPQDYFHQLYLKFKSNLNVNP